MVEDGTDSGHHERGGVLRGAAGGEGVVGLEAARRAEDLGFSTLLIPDTLGPTLSPLVALAHAAAATTTLRVGTHVLATDFRNPVLVAREAATLDLLCGGRLELGLGAGRPPPHRAAEIELNLNLAAAGAELDPGARHHLGGVTVEEPARIGSLAVLLGSPDEMAEELVRRREALGSRT